jgi:type II secretory pathway predicted ATPase ExeA
LLIGQPTLRRRLRIGDMAALDQRVALRYHIPAPALTPAEASGYIRRHLEHAGRSDTLFSDDAVRAIHAHARGLPRAINRLAITALLAACAAGKTIVDESSARAAIREEAAAATD